MTYKKYITPIQAHENVMNEKARMERLNKIASKLFPLENQELRTSFEGLTLEQINQVYASTL
tara:strand:- start:210 stop:395 length:186 start_codon:yes stop_codon:yes gene_type:complete